MSTIAIAMLPELGHLYATLKLARSLRLRGHQVYYLVGSDYEAYMRAQDLNFISLGEGFTPPNKTSTQLDLMEYLLEARMQDWALDGFFTGMVHRLREEIASLTSRLRPDLFLIDPYLPDVALIARELKLPFVFLIPNLTNPLRDTAVFNSQPDLAQVPELVLCAGEFDFPQARQGGKGPRFYLGPGVDLQRKENDFDWQKVDPTKRLILCSLGSQPQSWAGAKRFLQVIIDAVSELTDSQLIVGTGAHFAPEFQRVPANVIAMPHLPQLQILMRTDVLITHGGLNTIQEALLLGIPMIAFPPSPSADQPLNAARIAHHGLGLTGNMATVTAEEARALIERVMQTGVRERVLAFRQLLQKIDAEERGVKIVEALLAMVEKKSRAARAVAPQV
jgi:UDP:flavonoid glycosyltransferase YjiC (YdhE family)